MNTPLLVDTDPGVDDALALAYVVALGTWDLVAITAVAGNVPVEVGFANARALAALLKIEDRVPVFAGCSKPLFRPLRTATHVHRDNGMGDVILPPPSRPPGREDAVSAIDRLSREHPGQLEILALGPLTNIASALLGDTDLAGRIRRIVAMGGSIRASGNVTPHAEFNAFVDPEALEVVSSSGIPFLLVGLDATDEARVTDRHLAKVRDDGSALPHLRALLDYLVRVFEGRGGAALHDPLAAAAAADRGWVSLESGHLKVETRDEQRRGTTWLEEEDDTPVEAAMSLARPNFVEHFVDVINRL